MKKVLVPSRSQRNHASGLFQAGSLGSLKQGRKKPVDMDAAKAKIRFNRTKVFEPKAQTPQQAEESLLKRRRAWWRYRQHWKSFRVGDRVGKINPKHDYGHIFFVDFPDGTSQKIERA